MSVDDVCCTGLFQSTLSQGERHWTVSADPKYYPISIHALARRATMSEEASYRWDAEFQSTLSQGERRGI